MNKKRDEVIGKLKGLIKTKMYSKGSKLPPERDLAASLGVSRSLLREAIITLEAWGILESVERQGIFVKTPNLADLTESIQFMPFWLEDLLPQVMEMRWILNVSAAELAAHRRTDEDLVKLETSVEKLKSGNCDTEAGQKESSYWEITLHNLYIASAHNLIMDRVNEGLSSLIERNTNLSNITFMSISDWFDVVVSQHEKLSRGMVLEGLQREQLPRVTLDFDGSVRSTKGHAEGTAVGFNKNKKGARSYYPLFCTVAQTGQFFDLLHRPDNVHGSHGAAEFIRTCITEARAALQNTIFESRVDSAFFNQGI